MKQFVICESIDSLVVFFVYPSKTDYSPNLNKVLDAIRDKMDIENFVVIIFSLELNAQAMRISDHHWYEREALPLPPIPIIILKDVSNLRLYFSEETSGIHPVH